MHMLVPRWRTQAEARGRSSATATRGGRLVYWIPEELIPFYAGRRCFHALLALGGFGNVIVEAMAMGTHVVATDCPYGPAEIISKNETGTLVLPGDESALADAIIKVLEDEKLRASLAENGRRRAMDFTADKVAEAYGSLFETVLTKQAQRSSVSGDRDAQP
jgi:glycosyltransferase involved in cell wall biosynthesis